MTPNPAARLVSKKVRIRRLFWLLEVIAIVFFGGALGFGYLGWRAVLLTAEESALQAQAREFSQRIALWNSSLRREMLALAEQRGLRQGVIKMDAEAVSADWRRGFQQAADAICRAFLARNIGVESFAIRDLEGQRIAGSGAAVDTASVRYPDIRRLFQQRVLKFEERSLPRIQWAVPVRDVNAKPLAFLIAEVNPEASRDVALYLQTENDLLLCLEDSAGLRFWNYPDSLCIPQLDVKLSRFSLGKKHYQLVRAGVPGTNWRLTLAASTEDAFPELQKMQRRSILFASFGMALLIAVFLLFQRIIKKLVE